jgi:hypothetical protein
VIGNYAWKKGHKPVPSAARIALAGRSGHRNEGPEQTESS